MKKFLRTAIIASFSLIALLFVYLGVLYVRQPSLNELHQSFDELTADLGHEQASIYSTNRDRAFFICGFDLGEDSCPEFRRGFKVNTIEACGIVQMIARNALNLGWQGSQPELLTCEIEANGHIDPTSASVKDLVRKNQKLSISIAYTTNEESSEILLIGFKAK